MWVKLSQITLQYCNRRILCKLSFINTLESHRNTRVSSLMVHLEWRLVAHCVVLALCDDDECGKKPGLGKCLSIGGVSCWST
jgi:hypothetical protein